MVLVVTFVVVVVVLAAVKGSVWAFVEWSDHSTNVGVKGEEGIGGVVGKAVVIETAVVVV